MSAVQHPIPPQHFVTIAMSINVNIAIVTKCCGKNKVTINYAQNNNIYSLEK
jgi:hypothetical protein